MRLRYHKNKSLSLDPQFGLSVLGSCRVVVSFSFFSDSFVQIWPQSIFDSDVIFSYSGEYFLFFCTDVVSFARECVDCQKVLTFPPTRHMFPSTNQKPLLTLSGVHPEPRPLHNDELFCAVRLDPGLFTSVKKNIERNPLHQKYNLPSLSQKALEIQFLLGRPAGGWRRAGISRD